jgi:uncharacterized protein (TIGR02246 family)
MTSSNSTRIAAGPDRAADAVRNVFDETSKAWAAGDAEVFAGWYTDDATVILPGIRLRGRSEIGVAMAAAFMGPLHGSRRSHELDSVRFLGATTAVVTSSSATLLPGETEPGAQPRERATWVLSRSDGDGEAGGDSDGRWLIEAFHSCPENAA